MKRLCHQIKILFAIIAKQISSSINSILSNGTDDQMDSGHGKITSIEAIHLVNIPESG